MTLERNDDRYDLPRMIAGALYSGMFINILIPAGLAVFCYYLEQKGAVQNSIGQIANPLFYGLAVVSIVEGAVAVIWRNRSFALPMVRRRETFEQDVAHELTVRLRPVFLLLAAIALNGVAYFVLTGRFKEGLALMLLSFIAFQVVRPRYSGLRRLIEQQEEMVEKGRYMEG